MPQRWHGTLGVPLEPPADSQFWHIMSPPASNSPMVAPQRMQFGMEWILSHPIYWFAGAHQRRKKSVPYGARIKRL